ncbi:MAG: S1 family peptidase [Acidobacteriota bacterium]
MSRTVSLCIAVVLIFTPSPTNAQSINSQVVSEALQRDAVAYAEYFGTDIEEALRRLELQTRIGVLDAALTEDTADTFAGLWIDHEPEFNVVALFTDTSVAQEWLSEETLGDLASIVTVQSAAVTLKHLESNLEEVEAQLRAANQIADLQINVRENQVEILTLNPIELMAALSSKRVALPPRTEIVEVESLSEPSAEFRGGRLVTHCTSGFAVISTAGRLGLSTAGHCPNSSTYEDSGTPLSLISETFQGSHDVQWHSVGCNDTILNQVFDGTTSREISGSVGRNSQAVGTWVCRFGRKTGASCGLIWGKSFCPSYIPNGRSTFITVTNNQTPSQGGDSGGPWFVGNHAYGIHSGSSGFASIYMAVDYMATQGYSVLKHAAGVVPSAIVSCYNDSEIFRCSASAQGGSPPHTFSNWQYYGPATSWLGTGPRISGSFGSFPGCRNGAYNSVIVQVTDACDRVGNGGETFYCPEEDGCGLTFLCEDPGLE